MRPTTRSQSATLQPLTYALGTEGRLRVLRVLAAAGHPVGVQSLAKDAALNVRGTRNVLRELEELGAITIVPGASQQVVLREAWPLSKALQRLFESEAAYREELLRALREAAKRVTPPPVGVWIAGPHAAGTDTPIDPLLIVCYGRAKDLSAQCAQLTRMLADLSDKYDLPAPEVRALSRADIEVVRELNQVEPSLADERLAPPLRLLMGGLPALPWLKQPSRRARQHADHDASLALIADAIAGLLRRSPDLVTRARADIEARRATASEQLQATLDEWAMLLDTQPPARLAAFLRRNDERMRRLRQSLPFLNVLTPSERAKIDEMLAKANERQELARIR